jgi:hypothetical protein
VAHSAGGLVARVAWSVLVAADQTDLVQRIITLGTPHQGSYSVVQLFSYGNSTFLALGTLAAIAASVLAALLVPGPVCSAVSIVELLAVVATWPSMYQLLPFLGSPDAGSDPNRPLLYTASNWTSQQLAQKWLTHASTVWDPLMAQPSTLPPAAKLTTIAGTGGMTPDILTQPKQLGTIYAYGSTTLGDGAVTVEDALIPASWTYTVVQSHQDLPAGCVNAGIVAAEVTAVRSPPTPPPPTVAVAGTLVPTLGAPPYTAMDVLGGRGLTVQMGGDC